MEGGGSQSQASASSTKDSVGQVLDDVEAYLGGWMARLQRVLGQCQGTAKREAQLNERIADFDRRRLQWQARQQQEMQQIQQGAQQLADAWQRLESEQRQWLNQRQSPTVTSSPTATNHHCQLDMSAAADSTGPGTATSRAAHGYRPPTEQSMAATGGAARESAVRQFEQLRREVGQYGRGNRH